MSGFVPTQNADDGPSPIGQQQPRILPAEFESLRELVREEIGLVLADSKRAMLAARLARRLRHLGLSSYGDYYRYVRAQGPGGPERQELINCVTTNKTDFFRESHHFDFLRDVAFPQFQERARRGGPKRLRLWSAGCSTGEEPYSLAICLLEHFAGLADWDVKILATDVDTDVLDRARLGLYAEERVEAIPLVTRRRHFFRGTGQNAGLVSLRPEPRALIDFAPLNLMAEPWPLKERFDVIFCRNVMIYFSRQTQQHLLSRFAAQLAPEGYLFLGHSENAHGLSGLLQPLGGTVHVLSSGPRRSRSKSFFATTAARTPPAAPKAPDVRGGGTLERLASKQMAKPAPALAPEGGRTLIVGDVVACDRPTLLKTLLGSCVSACLFDPQKGIGGMNHISLPGEVADEGICTRYGVHAMELLINEIMKLGGERRRLRAKVFGGAKVLNVDSEALNVGARNARFVLEFLHAEGIEVVARCLGGTSGMRVHFYPHTGKALIKPLDNSLLAEIARDEIRYSRDVLHGMSQPPEGDVTLF